VRRCAAIALLGALAFPCPAAANDLVATLSDSAVEINSSFTGSRIVVFGAVRETPGPETPGEYGVAVVVEGPPEDMVVRRKENSLGIWVNRAEERFAGVPSYYVVHLSESLSQETSLRQLEQYRLGLENMPFLRDGPSAPETAEFARALIRLKAEQQLYVERSDAVTFLAPTVFRTTFFLPATIPTGDYRVGVYLFKGMTLLAGETETLVIEKIGLSAQIARFAREYGLLYGIVTVLLGVSVGWIAGVMLRRG